MNRPLLSMASVLVVLIFASSTIAQLPFKRKTNWDPNADYELTERHGPWLIMCASFAGDAGEQQALGLVRELRDQYQLQAFTYRQHFDYTQPIPGTSWEAYTLPAGDPRIRHDLPNGDKAIRPARMKVRNMTAFDEIAVVVGNFATLDDNSAQKTLERIKHLKPRTLEVNETVDTNQRMGVWREIQRRINLDPVVKAKGPMRAAFLMPNPMIPEEYFVHKGIDKFVMDMNKNIKFSLLNCSGPYSVRVATFRGETTFETRQIENKKQDFQHRLQFGKPVETSKLADAAENAHLMTTELRRLGVEAYEFHDRHESFVCVGSFPWATRKLATGQDELNPDVAKVITQFKANVENFPGLPGAVRPKTLPALRGRKIYFDIQPLPVMVPQGQLGSRGRG